ncbi:hypothetical protein HS125_06610 [bacterium]|nr:hypothetical protein [bacterium]
MPSTPAAKRSTLAASSCGLGISTYTRASDGRAENGHSEAPPVAHAADDATAMMTNNLDTRAMTCLLRGILGTQRPRPCALAHARRADCVCVTVEV